MDRSLRVALGFVAAVTVAFAAFSIGYTLGSGDGDIVPFGRQDDELGLVEDAYDKIRSTAVDPPAEDELARGAIEGMVDVLKEGDDPYAFFYTPSGYRSFQELTTGRFSGIGVWLKQKRGDLEIVSVLPATPALRSGLQRGDVIRTIDGAPVVDMTSDDAVARIKGPEGTEVSLGVVRDGESLNFTIERAEIELPNLLARIIDEDLGYLRLFGFARGAGEQLRDELDGLVDDGAKGI
ncbi:MAG: PDZ domain-containing protein, partial [Actinomycetota bacterium]|nr:PDZ domain-containing protein [Actinomycetota bacterium]